MCENRRLLAPIKTIPKISRGTYGNKWIHVGLIDMGIYMGQNRVARLIREKGITARHKKKYKATTDSNHNHKVAPNLRGRNFNKMYWVTHLHLSPVSFEGYLFKHLPAKQSLDHQPG
jgi:hypothetical protein